MSFDKGKFPQFFITAPVPCPYLPGQMERKVFTHVIGSDPRALVNQLTLGGFRRSQNIAYRPGCDSCNACASARVPVADFSLSKSFKRVLRANQDLVGAFAPAQATQEHYDLFRSYIDTRHADGGMADMSILDFAAMIDETMVDTRLIEYRYPRAHPQGGQLVAAVLIDILQDGLSMIYSFYDPSETVRSLGSFMILDCISRARLAGMKYVYLGYYVEGSRKMAYKARFLPQERLVQPQGWVLHTKA